MKQIFIKKPSLKIKLILAIMISLIFIVFDGKFYGLIQTRNILENVSSSLYYFANAPRLVLDGISDSFIDTNTLQLENKALKAQLIQRKADLLLLSQLKIENQRLRLLLDSPLRNDEYKKIVEVLIGANNSNRQQVVINQGATEGVHVGQPVINEDGVVGQVISVSEITSRVLLISDATHAIPVKILRNDLHAVASGTGDPNELILDYVPNSADIVKGDILVTSGAGARFPEGYPVAIVEEIAINNNNHFLVVKAKPVVTLEKLRYLLLLWPNNTLETISYN